MNTLSNELTNEPCPVPVTCFLYKDMNSAVSTEKDPSQAGPTVGQEGEKQPSPGHSAQEVSDLVKRARDEAVAETEKHLAHQYEAKSAAEAAKIREALELFLVERKSYFSRIEAEVVQLALAISAKILHRAAQVDPQLVAALVRIAVEKLHDGSSVSVRVSPAKAEKWTEYMADLLNGSSVTIVEDAHLGPEDCILETDLGSANFSIEAQLKEVEQGFFDLIAQRPPVK